jgi:AcrR family transcriptional regulator
MTHARQPARRQLGRPPAFEAVVTRERIVHAAREAFAELGYAATTNKALADAADVTTGAIYHYFDSKLDLYREVSDEVQQVVYSRFEEAVDGSDDFVRGFDRVLDVAHALNNEDPSLARFLGAVGTDLRRNPELRALFKPSTIRRERFIRTLVDIGVATGEIDESDRERTVALVRAVLVGLVDAVSDDPSAHLAAIDGMKLLIGGKLLRKR